MSEEISDAVDIFVLNQAKFLQKVVQEFDSFKYTVIQNDQQDEDEELPPLPEKFTKEPELTPTELEAKELYEKAMVYINKTKPNRKEAFPLLKQAAEMGNRDAKALLAWGYTFGNPSNQNLNEAKHIFEELAEVGHPEGHMGLGFMYASGIGMNVSQARALVHYTFAAIGGNTWAQMALGYRYFSGVTVTSSCEKALDFYRLVADKG